MMKHDGQKIPVNTLCKKLKQIFDPLSILRANKNREMILLESADIVTKVGEKSMLLLDLAVKVSARCNRVSISALLPEGQALLAAVEERFQQELVSKTATSLTLAINDLASESDVLEKMRKPCALDVLRTLMSAIDGQKKCEQALILGGAFSYDFIDHFERLPAAKNNGQDFPDFLFYLPLSVVIIDHPAKQTQVYAHSIKRDGQEDLAQVRLNNILHKILVAASSPTLTLPPPSHTKKFDVDIADDDFAQLVEQCKDHIRAGDVYQIVPSRTFSCDLSNPHASYQALRKLNPSPYMFYMQTSEWTLFGASPETYIKVDKLGTRMSVRPIAGTRRRGFDEHGVVDQELDSREEASLCLDEKELAEHMMLVDLARNDVASVCKPKSRVIKKLLGIERFSHVMHLVSQVEGRLLDEFDALSAYQASINMGTLMGAPKVRAAELLRGLEKSKRGFYGGAVGYVNKLGDMDSAIIIRSALVKEGKAYIRAGAGVVYDSDPKLETKETLNKAAAVLRAIEMAGGA